MRNYRGHPGSSLPRSGLPPRCSEAAELLGGWTGRSFLTKFSNEREQKTGNQNLPAAESAPLLRHGKLLLLWILQGTEARVQLPWSPRKTRGGAGRTRVSGAGSARVGPPRKQAPPCLSAPAGGGGGGGAVVQFRNSPQACERGQLQKKPRLGHLLHLTLQSRGHSCFVEGWPRGLS